MPRSSMRGASSRRDQHALPRCPRTSTLAPSSSRPRPSASSAPWHLPHTARHRCARCCCMGVANGGFGTLGAFCTRGVDARLARAGVVPSSSRSLSSRYRTRARSSAQCLRSDLSTDTATVSRRPMPERSRRKVTHQLRALESAADYLMARSLLTAAIASSTWLILNSIVRLSSVRLLSALRVRRRSAVSCSLSCVFSRRRRRVRASS